MESLRRIKVLLLFLVDIFFINIAYAFSFFIKHSFNFSYEKLDVYIKYAPIIVLLYIVPLIFMRMYRSLWRLAGIDEFMRGVIACFLGVGFNLIFMTTISNGIPVMITLMSGIFITVLLIGFRLSFRVYRRMSLYGTLLNKIPKSNVLIIGAGACGRIVLTEMKRESGAGFKPIGVIDDDKHKIGTFINGVKVLGDRKYIKEAVKNNNVDLILIAIPSLSSDDKKEIIALCHETKTKVKLMPGLYEMIGGQVNLTKMRDVDLKDLLGREEVKLDKKNIKKYINFKRVLVTGGGGSIGSELCRQIAYFNPKELIILDIYENNAYELQNELSRVFPNVNQKVVIASVRDKLKIENVFDKYKPQVVFHAAAHKHVPLMEFNPEEAIKNNVVGTLNVAEAASKYGVDKFVLISTDKAVNPTNVMGATKRICEMIIQAINLTHGHL
ncbi:polysaccharide biosynthesis protein [Clostridium tarantellae]|uniref:NAD-dependent epimerase/dehydratase family protein n=1 Tax=Clostridium tarantellae TaxID=39493 RepID=A0A6I1MJ68_9CLOT|nr:polysaccharide biosynthesis protein [Clostridium tarantellae]MPQ43425.1 NAD-dependent epimerase/dehydratase family protein [Clostridium tarantellae]